MAVRSKSDNFDAHMLPQRNDQVSSGAHCPPVRTNAYPLNTFVDPGSLRSHREWDWRTGEMRTVTADVLDNAKRSMTRLCTKTVTSERTHPDPVDDYYGYGATAAPSTPKASRKRKGR